MILPRLARAGAGPAGSAAFLGMFFAVLTATVLFTIAPAVGAVGRAVRGEHGMAATDDPLASLVARDMLASGGNAIDAAVGAAFTLAVVYPQAGNLGGGGFMVAHLAGREDVALDFRETAPAAATADMFLDASGKVTGRSLTGGLAAGVPGTVAGLHEAHRRYGRRAWKELLQPAIALAESGYVVSPEWHDAVRVDSTRLSLFPDTRALFLPEGHVPAPGTRWRDPDLAGTLRRIAEHGPDGFYRGETAAAIVTAMARTGGIVAARDLEEYRPRWRDPIRFQYRGQTIISMPPPSSGGITLALIARILESWDLAALGWKTPRTVHLEVEAMRRAFAVRNSRIGDPDVVPVDVAGLLSDEVVHQFRATMREDAATPSTAVSAFPGGDERPHTTHFSIVDQDGNAVALTTTLNDNFGSAVVAGGAGFLLNNEMDDFTARPGTPNLYGLVQGEANAIAPGKRMLSSMSPTVVLDAGGEVRLVTGASGGPTIITTVFQVISDGLDHGMRVDEAVRSPRFHHQQFPDEIRFEHGALEPAVIAALEALGHRVRESVPGVDAVGVSASIERRDGAWWGMPDPRRGGQAAGY